MTIRSGEVEIDLDGEKVVLKPTARALRTLCGQYGGLVGVMQGIAQLRDDAMADVVAAGTNASAEQRKQLQDAIFKAGLMELAPKLTRYCAALGNGGRDPDAVEEAGAETDDPNPE